MKIIESMAGKNILDYNFNKSNHAINLSLKSAIKVGGESVQVDPQILVQRLITVSNDLFEDRSGIFEYELCSFPPSIFDASGFPRETHKSTLVDAIWAIVECGLSEKGCKTFIASGDANTLKVQTAVSCAANGGQNVVLVGEDTDRLVLLCYYADMTARNIYFKSDTKKKTAKKFRIWDVKMTKTALGEETWMNNDHFKEHAVFFMSGNKDEVKKLVKKPYLIIWKTVIRRTSKFLNKISTETACVQVHALPPTSDAARFHSLRVYVQSQT
ncbi:unnamed protein product [Mytilus coruscus]|uniref:Uncharacterized protein n=1 Tax=Mytilus coruscus TaxID=42192 RepID=A0A6J8DJM5_MYTCO|nr:unnamed protein product [Mytilus coruscus]